VPKTYLSDLREKAVKTVVDFFDTLPHKPFRLLQKDEMPENANPPKDPNILAWEGEIDCGGVLQKVVLALKSTFPDTIPRVYLSNPPYCIPHVTASRDSHVCTVDKEEVFVNSAKPDLVVLETLHAASKVITEGLSGKNLQDFDLEFQAYWRQEANQVWLSLLSPGGSIREVVLLSFEPSIGESKALIAEYEAHGKDWVNSAGRNITQSIAHALYLPLPRPLCPPFPNTNLEINNAIREMDSDAIVALYRYLTKNQVSMNYMVFSFEINNYHAFGGWIHTRPSMSRRRPLCRGFRDDQIPGEQQLTLCFGKRRIVKARVDRVDGDRLQARIGNDRSESTKDKNVMIVGCGAIGSRIGLTLAMSGINNLILVDNDIFSTDNVARHICPIGFVGVNKAEAVKKVIHLRLPHVLIKSIPKDFYSILSEEDDFFRDLDLIVSATANGNLNVRLNESIFREDRKTPVLYTWTEAYGYASHAILVVPGRGGCFRCTMDPDFDFRHRVTMLKASEALKQEVGCQSSFFPFSALDSQMAACTASKMALSYFYGDIEKSSRWVYVGDLEEARSARVPISNEYDSSGSNQLLKFSLPSRYDCPICKAHK